MAQPIREVRAQIIFLKNKKYHLILCLSNFCNTNNKNYGNVPKNKQRTMILLDGSFELKGN